MDYSLSCVFQNHVLLNFYFSVGYGKNGSVGYLKAMDSMHCTECDLLSNWVDYHELGQTFLALSYSKPLIFHRLLDHAFTLT